MRLKDMYVQPGYLIRRLHQRSTAEFASAVDGAGSTQVQMSLMLAIAEFPGTDSTRISDLIWSDRATIGQALLRLEQRKLVRRRVGTRDKRTKRLVVTSQGEDLISRVAAAVQFIGDELFGGLDDAERATFLHLLAKVVTTNEGTTATGMWLKTTAEADG